jgi:hypothetical protein
VLEFWIFVKEFKRKGAENAVNATQDFQPQSTADGRGF